MKSILFVFVLFCLISCKSEDEFSISDFKKLNGYWQITDVIYPDGSKKIYSPSSTIDYFEVDSLSGFRKKVYPKIDGKFNTNSDAIQFYIVKKASNGYFISYNNGQNAWQESVTYLSDDYFSLVDSEGMTYTYRRYKQFDIVEDGETTE